MNDRREGWPPEMDGNTQASRSADIDNEATAVATRPGSPHPAELITVAARRFGTKPAYTLVTPDGAAASLGFEEIDHLSDAFAGFLTSVLRLKPGNVLAVQLANGLPFPIVVFGAWKAGLIVSPINPYYTATETRRQLLDSDARVLVADRHSLELVQNGHDIPDFAMIVVEGPGLRAVPVAVMPDQPPPDGMLERYWTFDEALRTDRLEARSYYPVSLYQYTGGTTGRSKAAIITAANLVATKSMVAAFFAGHGSPISGGTALTALPLYHIFAFLFGMLVYVDAGTNNLLVPAARPVSNLRPAFEDFPIDWMAGVDTLYAGLLAEDWFRNAAPTLRFAIAGGAALRPAVALEWERLVGPLLEGYGLTETTGIVSCNPLTEARRAGSIGIPVSGSSIRIVDDEGADVSPGTAGELLVRGPQVAAGYLDPRDDVEAFANGWFRTGDIAVLDSLGLLTIMDRKKDMILVSGFNVYPNEVEAVLSLHPGVSDVAVIGFESAKSGEAVRAFVVRKDETTTAEDLDRHCRISLAAYKIPREFIFADELPKTAVGKTMRAALRN